MLSALISIVAIALIVGGTIGWLARGATEGHRLAGELRDSKRRTSGVLQKPIPGREQFLRDLRGDGAKRDGLWRSRRRRDHEARNRRRA